MDAVVVDNSGPPAHRCRPGPNAEVIRPDFSSRIGSDLADWDQAIACLRGGDGRRGKVVLETGVG